MDNIVNISEHIEDRKWNEAVSELLASCDADNPMELLILLETYMVGKRKVNGEF